jgi:DMSO reductase family type II enzyme chaperone
MPTPSKEKGSVKREVSNEDWAAHSEKPRRSVFGNYIPADFRGGRPQDTQTPIDNADKKRQSLLTSAAANRWGLQVSIDTAMARAFLYQFLARAFEDPVLETWTWLTDFKTHAAFLAAARMLANSCEGLDKTAATLTAQLQFDNFELFQAACITAFGHAARGDCPLNEIEYGDLKADTLFQPHRLADLAAFYCAFGLEVANGAAERPDHLGMELEFMSVLAAKEAYAYEYQLDDDRRVLCGDAQKKFLREHLGRWSPGFARRLARAATNETLAALAEFTRDFIVADCERFGLSPGSEELLLRPADEAAESLCASCGLQNLPPGAGTAGATT